MLSESDLLAIRAQQYQGSADALLTTDTLGYIVDCNQHAEVLLGYPRSMLLGQPVDMLIPEAMREGHRRHLLAYRNQLYRRPMGLGQVLVTQHQDGRVFPIQIFLSPVVVTAGTFILVTLRRCLPAQETDLPNLEPSDAE